MEIEPTVTQGVTVFRIHGRLDAASSSGLESALLPRIGPEANRVVLDLSDVEFVSSGGLRVILQLAREVRACEGAAAVFGAGRSVQNVFRLTGIARIVPLYATESEAVAAVRT
jgi:anti-sigma B factor antagonist